MKFKLITLVLLFSFTFLNTLKAHEQLQCLIISEILSPTIIDDKTLMFEMRDDLTLKVDFKRECLQLSYHQSFSCRALRGEICIERGEIMTRAGETCIISSIIKVS